jgi:hypothetical protein
MSGMFFIGTAVMGLWALRHHRPAVGAPYALLAAVLLVWHAQAGHVQASGTILPSIDHSAVGKHSAR